MIEFPTPTDDALVLNTDIIANMQALPNFRCLLTLKDGRQITAIIPYAEVRRLIIEARSGFATAVTTG